MDFFVREWKSVAVFGGGFSLLMAAAILWIDPAFFYPRLQTDTLYYYLKGLALVQTGSTVARLAVNTAPFPYAAMPGVLRAPFIMAFRDFDTQLRAMQLFNIPIVASVALMSAYIVSWSVDRRYHWATIGFAFVFTAISPVWIANVFSPLADAPYAAFTLLAVLISIRIICNDRPLLRNRGLIAIYCLVFVVAFMLRFTGPVLLVFAAALAKGRYANTAVASRKKWIAITVFVLLVALLVALNANAIFGKYIAEPFSYLAKGDKPGMVLNLLGAAVPDQIFPGFHLAFSEPPVVSLYHTRFAHTPTDALWTLFGLLISTVVVTGMWHARNRLLPEILYFLAPLVVLALMLPSTSRYLMSYQPFLWLFFVEGARLLYIRLVPSVSINKRTRIIAAVVIAIVSITAGGLRWYRVAGTGADRSLAVSVAGAPALVTDVSKSFRSMRNFIETLPRDSTLLIGASGQTGRWTAITGRLYYQPDSLLESVAAKKNVYVIIECGTLEACQSFPEWKNKSLDRLCMFGEFDYDSVFAVKSKWARAEILRLRPAT